MTPFFFLLLMASLSTAVAGQVCFKLAMTDEPAAKPRNRAFWMIAGLIGATLGFFLWLSILPHFPLSYLYPIEALDRILVAVAASLFLREKLSPRLLLGIGVITGGTMLVSMT